MEAPFNGSWLKWVEIMSPELNNQIKNKSRQRDTQTDKHGQKSKGGNQKGQKWFYY